MHLAASVWWVFHLNIDWLISVLFSDWLLQLTLLITVSWASSWSSISTPATSGTSTTSNGKTSRSSMARWTIFGRWDSPRSHVKLGPLYLGHSCVYIYVPNLHFLFGISEFPTFLHREITLCYVKTVQQRSYRHPSGLEKAGVMRDAESAWKIHHAAHTF